MIGWAIFAGIFCLLGASNCERTGMAAVWLAAGVALIAVAVLA